MQRFNVHPMALALSAALGTGLAALPGIAYSQLEGTGTPASLRVSPNELQVSATLGESNGMAIEKIEIAVEKIDRTVGVVTGLEFKVAQKVRQEVAGSGALGQGAESFKVQGSGSAEYGLLLPAVQKVRQTVETFGGCSGDTAARSCDFFGGSDFEPPETLLRVPEQSLDDYIGEGTLIGEASVSDFKLAVTGTGAGAGEASLTGSWDATLTPYFKFFKHASPQLKWGSESTQIIDFGTVSAQGVFKFFVPVSLLNDGDRNTAGLDLDRIDGTGDTTVLGFELQPFQNLPGGEEKSFMAVLQGDAQGRYSAQFKFFVSDQDIGAPGSRLDQVLTVQLTANVVPEPGTWALMLGGLAGLGWAAARRRRSSG